MMKIQIIIRFSSLRFLGKCLLIFSLSQLVLGQEKINLLNPKGVFPHVIGEDFIFLDTQFTYYTKRTIVQNGRLNHFFFFKPEDTFKNKAIFIGAKRCSKPDSLFILGKPTGKYSDEEIEETERLRLNSAHYNNGLDIWQEYSSDQPPLAHFRETPELPELGNRFSSYFSIEVDPMNKTFPNIEKNDCLIVYVGYGLGFSRQKSFQNMLDQKTYERVFDTRYGIQLKGRYQMDIRSISHVASTVNSLVGPQRFCDTLRYKGCEKIDPRLNNQ
jgi:hypothetical protein